MTASRRPSRGRAAEGRTAIIPFVTAGYPTLARSEELLLALVRGGADIVEIGVPFSDPLADGATVQRTSQKALEQGVTLADAVAMVKRLREEHGVTVPILFMGYYNPMLRYGLEQLAADSAAAGADGFIIPDLPAEESDEFLAVCRRHGLDIIFLLAPTSTNERIDAVAQRASGFIYCVSLTGVTGQRDRLPDLTDYLGRVRARSSLPIAIGFGVSTPEHVRQVGEVADGAVVASALLNYLDTVPDNAQVAAAEQFVRGLRGEAEFPVLGEATPGQQRGQRDGRGRWIAADEAGGARHSEPADHRLPRHSRGDHDRNQHRRRHPGGNDRSSGSVDPSQHHRSGRGRQRHLHDNP